DRPAHSFKTLFEGLDASLGLRIVCEPHQHTDRVRASCLLCIGRNRPADQCATEHSYKFASSNINCHPFPRGSAKWISSLRLEMHKSGRDYDRALPVTIQSSSRKSICHTLSRSSASSKTEPDEILRRCGRRPACYGRHLNIGARRSRPGRGIDRMTLFAGQPGAGTGGAPPHARSGRLFRKYAAIFVGAVCLALVTNGAFDMWFSYQEQRALLVQIQRGQAESAASEISQFVDEIETQMAWVTPLPWNAITFEEWRFDVVRMLRQVPAVTEIAQLDAAGREKVRILRHAADVIESHGGYSRDPVFVQAMANKVYYGPVYLVEGSEPHMTIAVAGTGHDHGVIVEQVNLKFIWEVVSQIKPGTRGHAYVVDASGRLIADPDISLVLRNIDMSGLPQVRAARGMQAGWDEPFAAVDRQGKPVLSAHATVTPLNWLVFVELPIDEAYAPLYNSIMRSAVLLIAALGLALFAGLLFARRMVVPIRALQEGAMRIGRGNLTQRIAIKTNDELEALGDEFNKMAARLQES